MITENSLSVQSLASRYWQWPVKVKNLLSKVLKWDWPTTRHSPTHKISNPIFYLPVEYVTQKHIDHYSKSLLPGQPSLVHSQEPWRHTLQERQTFYCICKHFCGYTNKSLCMHSCLSPGVAILRNSGSWREMPSHVHTGTLRYLHTAITIQNLTDWNIMFNTCYNWKHTDRERKSDIYSGYEVTRACTAIYTFFLADLLDVETMAGCGASLGAFIVLHSNGALRDY